MSTVLRFLLATIALLATGCAAPMTKVVATRQDGAIDQQLFKKGDEVWITYRDKYARMKTKRGRVLSTDGDSVTLDVGNWTGPIDIEYRSIQTLSRPAKDRSYVGLSAGTLPVLVPWPQELPADILLKGAGISFRRGTYLNRDLEGNLSIGGKGKGVSSWISISGSCHFYTIMPSTYFLLGMGIEWPRPYHRNFDTSSDKYLGFARIGLGTTKPISEYFNVRVEANLTNVLYSMLLHGKLHVEAVSRTGLRIHFERRIH